MLKSVRLALATALTLAAAVIAGPACAEPRLALVIGEGAYPGHALPTAVNDAGLVAQTLQSAGFEVVQGRDLGANDLRQIVRDFLDRAQGAGPDAAVVVYVSGHGVQLEGENYLVPIDARLVRDSDVPIEGFRLSDLMRSLAAAPGRLRLTIVDAARDYPLGATGQPLARGLALVDPPQGFLVAFSEAPDRTAPDGAGPYGRYAAALVEMIRQPGLAPDDLFARVRLRVHEGTAGRQTPWHAANLGTASFVFFEPADGAHAAGVPRDKRVAAVPAEEAYALAVERDAIPVYQDFLRAYPDHPLAGRVKVLLAARREALVWRRTIGRNTTNAFWTYLRLYPGGPHAPDCRRRLVRLSAPLAPPPDFDEVVYADLPPPLPVIETVEYSERTIVHFAELPPPPPPPVYLLPPPPLEVVTIVQAPPPPPPAPGILPIPVPIPIPVQARPPLRFVAPVAPVTPQGPVVIPVAAPPPALAAVPAPVLPAPGAALPQPGVPSPVVPGQPGLQAPVRPLTDLAPAASANVSSSPAAPTAPNAAQPAAVPGGPGLRSGATGPGASQPKIEVLRPTVAPPVGAKRPEPLTVPGTAATPGPHGPAAASLGTQPAAPAPPTPAQPAAVPATNGGVKPRPASGPTAARPSPRRAAPANPGVAQRPAPTLPRPQANIGRPALPPAAAAAPRPVPVAQPRPFPPAPFAQPRPFPPAPFAQPRPLPPAPVAARPPQPGPGPMVAQRPAGPPRAAGAPPSPGRPGEPKKCVLPNGQPCPKH